MLAQGFAGITGHNWCAHFKCSSVPGSWCSNSKQPLFPTPAEWLSLKDQCTCSSTWIYSPWHLVDAARNSQSIVIKIVFQIRLLKRITAIIQRCWQAWINIWHPHIALIVIEMPTFHVRHLIARLYREGQSHYFSSADGEVEKQEVKWPVQNWTSWVWSRTQSLDRRGNSWGLSLWEGWLRLGLPETALREVPEVDSQHHVSINNGRIKFKLLRAVAAVSRGASSTSGP